MKFETQPVIQNRVGKKSESLTSSGRGQEKSPIQMIRQIRQKKILFVREHIQSQQNFLIQMEDNQEVIYLKHDCQDAVMIELTKIALADDTSEFQTIEYHYRAAQLLEYFTQNQVQIQYTTVLFSKINYAIALKKYNLTEEVINLLIECDQILKIKGKTLKKPPLQELQLAKIIQNKLLRLRIIFQCTLLFSESRRNKQALELAKGALKQLRVIFTHTIKLCQMMNITTVINKKQRANSEMSTPIITQAPPKLIYPQIVEAIFKEVLLIIKCVMPPTVEQDLTIQRSLQSRSQSMDKYSEQIFYNNNQINKLYPTIEDSHPILQLQILGLMQLSQVELEELYPISQCEMVIAEEVILELVMLAGLSFYSISTEMRFINQSQQIDNKQNLEIWLCKSLEVFYTYVPHSSLIFNQIYQVYKKLYGVDKQMIPEDQEITHSTKLLRPHPFNNKATLANKLVIVIKIPCNFLIQKINFLKLETQMPSISKHSQTQQKTNPSSNKNSMKKYLLPSYVQRHLLTQVDSEDQEDTTRSPTKLFLKTQKPLQQSTDIRQRVESLMSQILTSQAQLQQQKQTILKGTNLKQKYHIYMQKSSVPQIEQLRESAPVTSKDSSKPILTRSLSNSRKASQSNIGLNIIQTLQATRTSQLKYRYRQQMNTLPVDKNEEKQQTLFVKKPPENIKKQKMAFQMILNQRGISLAN